jgi:acetolactate synthase-1/2/3 large subunit
MLSDPEKNHICLIGDGSIMMALSDLSTLSSLNGAAKIIILNNSGYGMIKQTQDQWFGSEYFASNADSNMFFPDYKNICRSFGIRYHKISSQEDLLKGIKNVINEKQSMLCEVIIPSEARVNPQVKFGSPIESMDPSLDIEIFKSLMIVNSYLE